ncbi:MAG: GNAT family N-acetyltransferase [Ferruginibacter sp.]
MENVTLQLNEKGHGAFIIKDADKKIGEMVVGVSGNTLTVYHTEVQPEAEGKGTSKLLLNAMVAYAREHSLQVIPLCVYVHAQFRRHPELYADIWQQDKAQ